MRLLQVMGWAGITLSMALARPGQAKVVRLEIRERGPFAQGALLRAVGTV